MRVVMYVINSVSMDGRVIKEAATLASDGHAVTVVGMYEGPDQAREESFEGFQILRVAADPMRRSLGVARLGISSFFTPLWEALGLLTYYGRAWRAGSGLRGDVHHAHDLVTLPVAWACSRARAVRLIYDSHELFTEIGRLAAPVRWAFGLLERALIGRTDGVITVNESIAKELSRRYGIEEPTVLRNCPRTQGRFPSRASSLLRSRAGAPPDVPIVLYQGMFLPNRGLENLVRAMAQVRRAHLVLMGWGELRAELAGLASDLGVSDRVHLTDGVPFDELLAYTAGADLGVIPYRNVGLNNYYTSPNKLFEYCVAGVPVVASRFPELAKVVDGGGLGRTFDPESPADIGAKIDALIEDPTALAEVRRRVEATRGGFTWEVEVEKLRDVYSSLRAAA